MSGSKFAPADGGITIRDLPSSPNDTRSPVTTPMRSDRKS